ncbi:hypothetical protein [Crocosphaera sp.]|uniref:hypothetical protein n=1 Tax=Crocosphaera sp. TaxID=2729996 RepID=UPI00262C69CF|nr:hypothetical protein [Crocosphaera sp.]MDJ0579038.1 hypothetical protein [Crocosphaera sp.]
MTIIKAKRATVEFCPGVTVDGYMLPNGEFRVGVTGASRAVGYSKQWLSQVHTRNGKTLKDLHLKGFTGSRSEVSVDRDGVSGSSKTSTISLSDFRELIKYAAIVGQKSQALGILDALLDIGIEDYFRLSFGVNQMTLEEKRAKFYQTYAATINWLEEDREDFNLIEAQQRFLKAV